MVDEKAITIHHWLEQSFIRNERDQSHMCYAAPMEPKEHITLKIQAVPMPLVRALKKRAVDEDMTLRELCVGILSRSMRGNDAGHDDVRGAGSGSQAEAGGGGIGATVPDMPKVARKEKRLYPVQPVRTELVGRGDDRSAPKPEQGYSSEPCEKAGHHRYRHGSGWYCAECAQPDK